MSKFKVITCPNCDGKRVGDGPGFHDPGLGFLSCVQPDCRMCSGVKEMIVCYCCHKVAGRSLEDKCTSCDVALKE